MSKAAINRAVPTEHFGFLGFKVRDKVTGFEGVAASICFDLYGCVQSAVTPPAANGEIKEGRWFDNNRLEIISDEPVMRFPNFAVELKDRDERGPAEKPSFARNAPR
jgi:hypothetical protein